MINPNVKYYQIPSKSQLSNPKNLAIGIYLSLGFGSIGIIWFWDFFRYRW
jgi:hypothetical protein